jgi:transcriptional regulator with XRE-family HTH domain
MSFVRYNTGMTLGERLRFLREQRQLSRAQLAYLAGVNANHIYRIERGQRKRVGAAIMARLATALNVGIEELLAEASAAAEAPHDSRRLAEREPAAVYQLAPLTPDVDALTARLNALPAVARAAAVALCLAVLDLCAPDAGTPTGVEAAVDARSRRFARVFLDLPEESQAAIARQMAAEAGRTGARADRRAGTDATSIPDAQGSM